MNKYNAAVIGCGRIGFEFDSDPKRNYVSTHTGAYNSLPDVELAAVCDRDEKKLNKCLEKYPSAKGYNNMREMLEKEKLDIASICTPPQTHYPVLKEICRFPVKAVFCEKPLSDSADNAMEMVKLCSYKNIILQVNHQRRFDPLHIQLRDYIGEKKGGEVQQVNFYYTAGIKNTGTHMFDLLRFFFGDVEWLEAFPSKNSSGKNEDPNLDGILKFKSGIYATVQSCDVQNYLLFELNCFLEKAMFVLKNSGFELDFYEAQESKSFSGYKELSRADAPFPTDYQRNFMVNSVKHLVDCIKQKKESCSSGRDGLKVMELLEAFCISADDNGKRIFLPHEKLYE